MSRLHIVIVIVVALLWSSESVSGVALQGPGDVAHAVLHWQAESHHHHDDGTPHVDDSWESVAHLAADQLTSTLALPVSDSAVCGFEISDSLVSATDPSSSYPFLDGPLRPPRPTS